MLIIADGVFYIHCRRSACCYIKISKFSVIDSNIFESAEISGIGRVTANRELFKDDLTEVQCTHVDFSV